MYYTSCRSCPGSMSTTISQLLLHIQRKWRQQTMYRPRDDSSRSCILFDWQSEANLANTGIVFIFIIYLSIIRYSRIHKLHNWAVNKIYLLVTALWSKRGFISYYTADLNRLIIILIHEIFMYLMNLAILKLSRSKDAVLSCTLKCSYFIILYFGKVSISGAYNIDPHGQTTSS